MKYIDITNLSLDELKSYLERVEKYYNRIIHKISKETNNCDKFLKGGFKNIQLVIHSDSTLKDLNVEKIKLEDLIFEINKKIMEQNEEKEFFKQKKQKK